MPNLSREHLSVSWFLFSQRHLRETPLRSIRWACFLLDFSHRESDACVLSSGEMRQDAGGQQVLSVDGDLVFSLTRAEREQLEPLWFPRSFNPPV